MVVVVVVVVVVVFRGGFFLLVCFGGLGFVCLLLYCFVFSK